MVVSGRRSLQDSRSFPEAHQLRMRSQGKIQNRRPAVAEPSDQQQPAPGEGTTTHDGDSGPCCIT